MKLVKLIAFNKNFNNNTFSIQHAVVSENIPFKLTVSYYYHFNDYFHNYYFLKYDTVYFFLYKSIYDLSHNTSFEKYVSVCISVEHKSYEGSSYANKN